MVLILVESERKACSICSRHIKQLVRTEGPQGGPFSKSSWQLGECSSGGGVRAEALQDRKMDAVTAMDTEGSLGQRRHW